MSDVVDAMTGRNGPRNIMLRKVALSVAAEFTVTADDIQGRVRTRGIVEARQCFYLVVRQCTRLSLPEFGEAIGRDHSTILSGVRAALNRATHDAWYAAAVERLLAAWKVAA